MVKRSPETAGTSRAEGRVGRPSSMAAFRKLDPQEQERVLTVCRDEFATRGYALASTNAMVRKLGIPKGSIFYWFGSKDELYLHLVEEATRRYLGVVGEASASWPAEVLARISVLTRASMDFLASEPALYRLLMAFQDGEAAHLRERFLHTRLPDGMRVLSDWFRGVDTTVFRVGQEEVQRLLVWIVSGIKVEVFGMLARSSAVETLRTMILERLDRVIPIVAHAIYREPARMGYPG